MKIRKGLYQYNFDISQDSTISYSVENTHSGVWTVISKINSPRGHNTPDHWGYAYVTKGEAVMDIFQYEKDGHYEFHKHIGWGYFDNPKEDVK